MLKSATIWSAHYVLREDVLGSLEVGKFADFVVLSRDYLTVPDNEIHTLEPLLTAVGGEIVHLAPSFAKEIGLRPVGAQVELGRVGGNPEVWQVRDCGLDSYKSRATDPSQTISLAIFSPNLLSCQRKAPDFSP